MATTINASTSAGLVSTADTSGVLQLQTAGTTALTISTAQLATLAGGLNFSTLDAGITFNKTGALTNSTLNDYETGTWTPNIGGTATYSSQTGRYVKIGSQVSVWFDMQILLVGTGSGSIKNLPFTCNASAAGGGNVGYFSSLASSFVSINPIVPANTVTLTFETSTAATNGNTDNGNIWANSARCTGFATYQTT